MRYNKLVRDKIPQIIKRNGGRPKFHRAARAEFEQRLKTKLREEVSELCRSKNEKEIGEELADVLEVIDEIFHYYQFDRGAIAGIKRRKASEKGRFKKRIILEEA